jgi:tetratricopeptide (TPR) repeat protein/DNA-binding CsgD family transcriptional regulator
LKLLNLHKQGGIFLFCFLYLLGSDIYAFRQNMDSLLSIIKVTEDDAVRVSAMISFADSIAGEYPDSSLFMLEEANQIIPDDEPTLNKIRLLVSRAELFTQIAKYPESLQDFFEAKKLLESIENLDQDSTLLRIYIKMISDIGVLFIYTAKYDEAKKYFQMGLDYLNHIGADPSDPFFKGEFFRFNLNFGAVYARERIFDKAELYFTKAMQYLDDNKLINTATLLNNLSIIARENKELDKAFDLARQAIQVWEDVGYPRGLVQSYNNLANCYFDAGDNDNALVYYNKALTISLENGFGSSAIIALEQLATVYNQLGQYKKAYENHLEFKHMSDSLLDLEKVRLVTQLELQDKFDQRLNEARLLQQKREAEQKRRELIYSLIAAISVMSLIILVLLYSLQRSKSRRLRLEAEKNKLERITLEQDKNKLEEELEFKNKELATNVMYMVRKNELITQISEKLIKSKLAFRRENQAIIEEIIKELQSTTEEDVWTEFEIRFQQVHNDFYEKLNERIPNLSANEKKLCAFLRLNMSTKEISAITYQSINSITVARSRLRKKLELESDESLISFLESM